MERLAGKVILLWGWRRALAAFLVGALLVLSQAPFDFFAVGFVSFPVLVWMLDGATGEPSSGFLRRLLPAFATGWWFGFGYFVAGLWWTGNALLVEADEFAWALPLAVLALPAVLAVFYGLAAVIARLLWFDDLGRIAALAFGFGLAEWLRSFAFTGFPWNAIGYAAMPVPLLMQSASAIGIYGVNAAAVFVFAAPALLASRRRLAAGVTIAAVLVAAHLGYGAWRLGEPAEADGGRLAVRIVQPSVLQSEKWSHDDRERIFRTLLDLSAAPPEVGHERPQLILWPETAVPFLLSDHPEALAAIGRMLQDGQLLLAGAVRREGAGAPASELRYYNAVVMIDDAGEIVDASDKRHLVPFGEYLPLASLLQSFGLDKIVEAPGTFSAGTSPRLLALPGGARALPLICYEIIFPDEIAPPGVRPDILVNVTNDAWYGDSPGPYQHFRQAQVRAVEQGLPLLRAANNGISAAVDAHGRVIDAFALNVVGALDAEVPLAGAASAYVRSGGLTGWITTLSFAFLACVMALFARSRSN